MNNYPVWWDTTITIYNRYENPQTQIVTWYRHVISNCFWKDVSDKITIAKAVLETDNILCRIPKQADFLEQKDWVALTDAQRDNYFTLGFNDIIVRGQVSDAISEYTSGSRATDLLAKYKDLQGCLQIDKYVINVGSGRCDEHYYIKGI